MILKKKVCKLVMCGITPGPMLEAKTAFFFIKICKIKKKRKEKKLRISRYFFSLNPEGFSCYSREIMKIIALFKG